MQNNLSNAVSRAFFTLRKSAIDDHFFMFGESLAQNPRFLEVYVNANDLPMRKRALKQMFDTLLEMANSHYTLRIFVGATNSKRHVVYYTTVDGWGEINNGATHITLQVKRGGISLDDFAKKHSVDF